MNYLLFSIWYVFKLFSYHFMLKCLFLLSEVRFIYVTILFVLITRFLRNKMDADIKLTHFLHRNFKPRDKYQKLAKRKRNAYRYFVMLYEGQFLKDPKRNLVKFGLPQYGHRTRTTNKRTMKRNRRSLIIFAAKLKPAVRKREKT